MPAPTNCRRPPLCVQRGMRKGVVKRGGSMQTHCLHAPSLLARAPTCPHPRLVPPSAPRVLSGGALLPPPSAGFAPPRLRAIGEWVAPKRYAPHHPPLASRSVTFSTDYGPYHFLSSYLPLSRSTSPYHTQITSDCLVPFSLSTITPISDRPLRYPVALC